MSAVAFGALVRKRQEAPKGKSRTEEPPGLRSYVDVLSALVPVEVIAAHAAVMKATTDTTTGPGGTDVIRITDPQALKWAFWALLALSVGFYIFGFQKRRWSRTAVAGAFIPPLAFVAWSMAQTTSAISVLLPDLGQASRDVIVIIGAVALGLAATAVPAVLDKSPAKR